MRACETDAALGLWTVRTSSGFLLGWQYDERGGRLTVG
jgi:hypothetical protein